MFISTDFQPSHATADAASHLWGFARKFGAFMTHKRELRFLMDIDDRSFTDMAIDRDQVRRMLRMSFRQYCKAFDL